MIVSFGRRITSVLTAGLVSAGLLGTAPVIASTGYLFWSPHNFSGKPVKDNDPSIVIPLVRATAAEERANLVWTLRAGLNVAALQCQFSPILESAQNYNQILSSHKRELAVAYTQLGAYFRRTGGRFWQTKFDQHSTQTYNHFSTLQAQLSFCDTASSIATEAITHPRGQLYLLAEKRMQEFKNSLVPVRDVLAPTMPATASLPLPPFNTECWDKTRLVRKCQAG
ncbi:MAG: hypothetical protein ABF461_05950 [Zymomonas mobilis subsp. pomaceae]|uniref:Uncharacterized protein n=1 Tax=Zymomonas mobilis subsp. pomaceae (strain ATCC 29192 / DSM 22645 / JCM 10191 / CCUG 17912 / NBRC 13757 / NCIMB 11200 / NRRL B-4491 / Barker I) TaxID=579138 RepID=F8ERU4_ZYMMT|nr:hypothetical protein [Zymomonas mobilis]AEI38557.1 hypothetical protein Zymop_1669 [Zymomonas mobilis subsp. pomaceae ATCC 29192]MDX5948247.1 hypothetical protein [Zymomonas mobilis subsp. pomaceae]GEB89002.1 hypothetical protein ZMO02_06390 [Zymomonas mobilis subsp. pomaceae]